MIFVLIEEGNDPFDGSDWTNYIGYTTDPVLAAAWKAKSPAAKNSMSMPVWRSVVELRELEAKEDKPIEVKFKED